MAKLTKRVKLNGHKEEFVTDTRSVKAKAPKVKAETKPEAEVKERPITAVGRGRQSALAPKSAKAPEDREKCGVSSMLVLNLPAVYLRSSY